MKRELSRISETGEEKYYNVMPNKLQNRLPTISKQQLTLSKSTSSQLNMSTSKQGSNKSLNQTRNMDKDFLNSKINSRQREILQWARESTDRKKLLQKQKEKEQEQNKIRDFSVTPKEIFPHDFHYEEADEYDLPDEKKKKDDMFKLSNYENVEEEEEAEYERMHRKSLLNLSKTDQRVNFMNRLLESNMIDLSKKRYQYIKRAEGQKKLFSHKQILKSKTLPGLRCECLIGMFDELELQRLENYNSAFKNLRAERDNFANHRNESKDNQKNSMGNKTTSSADVTTLSDFKTKNQVSFTFPTQSLGLESLSSANAFNNYYLKEEKKSKKVQIDNKLPTFAGNRGKHSALDTDSNRSSVMRFNDNFEQSKIIHIDERFDELISLMDPNYTSQTQREFDVSKIIEKNDALKIKTVKPKPYELIAGKAPISSELIEMAKTILASGNLSYGR
jgi:hypothetical protein